MKETFKKELLEQSPSLLFSRWVLNKVPVLFNGDIELFIKWKEEFSKNIQVDSQAILFTGSSCNGFSLSPYKNFKDFDDESDIDIAIISEYFFDTCWFEIRNYGNKYHDLTRPQQKSFEGHRTRLIYWGTIATDKLLPIFSFSKEWIAALENMAKLVPTENRTINIRIYKNFESLREYYIDCFKKLQMNLIEPELEVQEVVQVSDSQNHI